MIGTTVTVTVVSKDMERSKDDIDHVFSEVERIEMMMNVFSEDSKLNRQGYLDNAHDDLIYLIKDAEKKA